MVYLKINFQPVLNFYGGTKSEMKYLLTFALIMLLLIFSHFTPMKSLAGEYTKIPKLSVESVLYNYGEVKKGEIISHAFIIKNKSDGELQIKDAHPD